MAVSNKTSHLPLLILGVVVALLVVVLAAMSGYGRGQLKAQPGASIGFWDSWYECMRDVGDKAYCDALFPGQTFAECYGECADDCKKDFGRGPGLFECYMSCASLCFQLDPPTPAPSPSSLVRVDSRV